MTAELTVSQRCRSKLLKPVVGLMSSSGRWRDRDENIIVWESGALTRGVKILASTQLLYRKKVCGTCGQQGRGLLHARSLRHIVTSCKTMTNLLTMVVEKRTHRDKLDAEMMAQENRWETASMIRSQNGTSRAACLETEGNCCRMGT